MLDHHNGSFQTIVEDLRFQNGPTGSDLVVRRSINP